MEPALVAATEQADHAKATEQANHAKQDKDDRVTVALKEKDDMASEAGTAPTLAGESYIVLTD